MARSLMPYFLSDFPWMEEGFELSPFTGKLSDVTISEDATHVYVEVPLPGINPKKIEVTFDDGVLSVQGSREEHEEDKKKKYYRKGKSTFSYQVRVPGKLRSDAEPRASYKEGMMIVSFEKAGESKPKRIEVKTK